MRRHLLSFVRAPLGYIVNVIATVCAHLDRKPGFRWLAHDVPTGWICWACETFCIQDGIQDDMMF